MLTLGIVFVLSASPLSAQKRAKAKKAVSHKSETKRRAARERDNERDNERPVVIVRNNKKYVLNEDNDLKRFDQPREAEQRYLERRLPRGEKQLPVERYFAAAKQIKLMKRYSSVAGKQFPSQTDAPNLVEAAPGAKLDKTGEQLNAGSTAGVLGTWTNLGPGNVGGRTRALIVDPNTPNTMYAAGVAGGIWKSTDGGASWNPLDDFMANIAVTTLAFDPKNSSTIYAGTGEGFFNGDATRGAGIFKTTDAGATWTRLAATATADFFYVQDLVVSPVNSQNIYVATRTGIQRSLDGGATWTNVLASNAANGANGAMDLVIRTDQTTDYVFAALGTFAQSHIWRNTDASGTGVWTDVYTETQMGRTSLALAPSNQSIVYAMFTCNSCAAGSNTTFTDAVYTDGLLAVVRSTANGDAASWTDRIRSTTNTTDKQSTLLLSNPVNGVLKDCGFGATNNFINQGWYHNQLAVDPTNPDKVWAAGTDVWRSDNGGTNWGVSSYWWFQGNGTAPNNGDPQLVHADNHTIVFHPNYNGTTNQTMFVGDDGGIYKTDNATGNVGYATGTTPAPGTVTAASPICANTATPEGTTVTNAVTWTPLNNGYQVTQFYHGLPYPDGSAYFGGTQDNGTNRGTNATGSNAWARILGGDGGYVAINPTNRQQIFAENTGLSFRRSDNGDTTSANGPTFAAKTTGITGDTFPFITVFQMDPTTPTRLWIGGRIMWRTDNSGDAWTRAISGTLTGGSITAIAIAPSNPNRVIGGAASGVMRYTTVGTTATATTAWTAQIATPRGVNNGTISWLAFDPTNEMNVYATISNFNGAANANGTNAGHVFKSADGGATWTLLDGTQTAGNVNAIPDIPAHSIVVDPNNTQRLYVGTDMGVFVSLDGGANWARETTGFSNVPVESLAVQNSNGVTSIYAFTHGRSAYKVTIPASCVTLPQTSYTLPKFPQTITVRVNKNTAATDKCDWNAVSNADFISLDPTRNGLDTGAAVFNVTENTTGAVRTGTVTVAGTVVTVTQNPTPNAANVSIGGRVLTTRGRAVKNARVVLTDAEGNAKTTVSNALGIYRFDSVPAGQTIILNAGAKGYTFAPRTTNLNSSVKDFDLVSQ